MNLNWTNQLREIHKVLFRPLVRVGLNFSVVAPLAPLVIGGFLVFVPESVQARPSCGSCEIAQVEEVYEEVPPTTQVETDSSQQAQFTPYGYYGQNYLLYVPTYSTELFDFVRRLVPEAGEVPLDDYVRRYRRGRDGFPVGIYNFQTAQRRARTLMREGIAVEIIPLNGDDSGSASQSARYVVYVRARNTSEARGLLSDIRDILQLDASRVRTRIKVGEFNNSAEANSVIGQLQDLGIPRNRISVNQSNRQAPRRYYSNENQPRISSSEDNNDTYMVVIPGSQEELPMVEAQVRQMGSSLGTNPEIYQAEDSNGKYIMVGPFEERITAEQMQRYLQDSGMTNAKVSIDR